MTEIGVGEAGVCSFTVVLSPGGVLAGVALATSGGTIVIAGQGTTTVGAFLQILGGSGKAAAGGAARRFLTRRLPKGLLKDTVQTSIEGAVDAIPFDFQTCR